MRVQLCIFFDSALLKIYFLELAYFRFDLYTKYFMNIQNIRDVFSREYKYLHYPNVIYLYSIKTIQYIMK